VWLSTKKGEVKEIYMEEPTLDSILGVTRCLYYSDKSPTSKILTDGVAWCNSGYGMSVGKDSLCHKFNTGRGKGGKAPCVK